MPLSVLRKVKANLWLCFSLKHWERRPAADDSASVYFQLMMWQAVGQTELDMLFSALHKQTHKMLNCKIHVFFSQNQECILPLQSELCKIVNRLARSHEYWLALAFSSGFALPIALSRYFFAQRIAVCLLILSGGHKVAFLIWSAENGYKFKTICTWWSADLLWDLLKLW